MTKQERKEECNEQINEGIDALFCNIAANFTDVPLELIYGEIIQCATEWYQIIKEERERERERGIRPDGTIKTSSNNL